MKNFGQMMQKVQEMQEKMQNMQEQMEDLLTRDLTPEDFELLLQLDELNDKKYKTVEEECFDTFKQVPIPSEDNYECRVCLELMKDDSIPEADEGPAVMLPCCGRIFHKDCISKWLKEYSKTCPSCRSDLKGVSIGKSPGQMWRLLPCQCCPKRALWGPGGP